MKKDFIFAPIMLVVGILLFLLKATGMAVHIAVSVVGLALFVMKLVSLKSGNDADTAAD